MDENKFWLRIWQTVGIVLCVTVVSIAGCTAHTDYRMNEMVHNGANPIDASCALSLNASTIVCAVRAGK